MNLRGSVSKLIRGENEERAGIREKLKMTPQNLDDIARIVPVQQEMYSILRGYYKKKGLQ